MEAELSAGLRLLEEFAAEDGRAEQALARIGALLSSPMPAKPARTLPREDLAWEALRSEGRGGKRTTAEYRERASALGIPLHEAIGWAEARDAVRAWLVAEAQIDDEHQNPFLDWGGLV